jgi:hypothetical protein
LLRGGEVLSDPAEASPTAEWRLTDRHRARSVASAPRHRAGPSPSSVSDAITSAHPFSVEAAIQGAEGACAG